MTDLVSLVRKMISDPSGASSQFDDQSIQDELDRTRDDVRYEALQAAPTIINSTGTNNLPETLWSNYYSNFQHWESDVTLQGYTNNAAWVVLTPAASDYIVGHWQFELGEFTTATVPGQYPPVFATGKVYDPYAASANLLEFWAASLARSYNFTAEGNSFQRFQMQAGLMKQAQLYRSRAKMRSISIMRSDIQSTTGGHVEHVPLLGSNDDINRM